MQSCIMGWVKVFLLEVCLVENNEHCVLISLFVSDVLILLYDYHEIQSQSAEGSSDIVTAAGIVV